MSTHHLIPPCENRWLRMTSQIIVCKRSVDFVLETSALVVIIQLLSLLLLFLCYYHYHSHFHRHHQEHDKNNVITPKLACHIHR